MTGMGNAIVAGVIVVIVAVGSFIFVGNKTKAQPAPAPEVVEVLRPISDVQCGEPYEFVHVERFDVNGRVAVNFNFGGKDRNKQTQYIWAENVLGQSTEIRSARRVVPSLAYSTVTFLCLGDPTLEGHKISNVEVMRYRLNLRRARRPQTGLREGGPARG